MKSKSCFSKLILICGNVNYWEDEWKVVDAAFLGFSKAFEIFPHGVLLDKPSNCDVKISMLYWMNRIHGRTQSVLVMGLHQGGRLAVTSGVPFRRAQFLVQFCSKFISIILISTDAEVECSLSNFVWEWVTSVPWLLKGQTVFCGVLNTVQPASYER